jgi:hypothetical protein
LETLFVWWLQTDSSEIIYLTEKEWSKIELEQLVSLCQLKNTGRTTRKIRQT